MSGRKIPILIRLYSLADQTIEGPDEVRLIRPFCAVRFVTEKSGYECNTNCIDKWSS
jgi:hypothetical protein